MLGKIYILLQDKTDLPRHYSDVMISAMTSQITNLMMFFLNRLFRRRSKLRVTGFCVGNSPGTGEFPVQKASKAENVSMWWRHRGCLSYSNDIHHPAWAFKS